MSYIPENIEYIKKIISIVTELRIKIRYKGVDDNIFISKIFNQSLNW